MKSTIVIILWVVIGLMINGIYHKMFHVVYFGANGILRELIATVLISGFITGVIVGKVGSLLPGGNSKVSEENYENDMYGEDYYNETENMQEQYDSEETYDYDNSPYSVAQNYELNAESEIIEYDGHAYAIFNYKTLGLGSFDACERYCEEMGGHLAVINSQEENDAIYRLVTDTGLKLAFFGYTDQEIEGEWQWVDGSDNSYTNWCKISGKVQPNNGAANGNKEAENYAEFYKETANGMWNDAIFGANTYRFVCEWE